jgi:hypothetical protein
MDVRPHAARLARRVARALVWRVLDLVLVFATSKIYQNNTGLVSVAPGEASANPCSGKAVEQRLHVRRCTASARPQRPGRIEEVHVNQPQNGCGMAHRRRGTRGRGCCVRCIRAHQLSPRRRRRRLAAGWSARRLQLLAGWTLAPLSRGMCPRRPQDDAMDGLCLHHPAAENFAWLGAHGGTWSLTTRWLPAAAAAAARIPYHIRRACRVCCQPPVMQQLDEPVALLIFRV